MLYLETTHPCHGGTGGTIKVGATPAVKTMMVYMLFRVIVYTFIKQAGYLGS